VDTAVQKVRVVETCCQHNIGHSLSVYNVVDFSGHGRTVDVLGTDVELAAWIF